jgi:class 3 adenylate cyclase/tetratricopeptide (TPR) repeat protein
LTALFCDVVNSVGMSVRLDLEELMKVLSRYQACCDDIVSEHGGYLAQFLGDGVLAYFGYPRANEDDAANAVSAGLAMLDAIRALNVALDPPLQVRVGIATGLVVISERIIRGDDRSVEIVGKMPNLAARLQSVARPGTVVIAESTRRVTRGLFTYRDLGAVPLKGFSQPVQVWEAMPSETAKSRFRARLQGAPAPFVGRQRELDRLVQGWAKARAGNGQVVWVIGEPGIGKSRLTEGLEQRLADNRHVRMHWYCSPQYADTALHPVTERLERTASIERSDPAAVKLDKLTRLLSHPEKPDATTLAIFAELLSIPLGRPSPLDGVMPEKRKELTMGALMAALARQSAPGPVMMVVEDVHWIDATTLEMLRLVVQWAAEHPVLLIITARPEFKPRWTDLPFVTVINLERLDHSSAEELCAHVASGSLSSEVQRQIVQRSDGVPLFVEELTKSVVESLEPVADDTSDHGTGSAAAIPSSLHDSLVARLDRLGPARHIANLGAAIGRRFDYELLAAVASKPDNEIRVALGHLKRSGLVNQSGTPPASTYLFRHALIRDAAYDSLLKTDRQTLHGQIASALHTKFLERSETEPEVLAYHLSQSSAATEAIPYWEKAGLRAASRAAHVEAVDHYSAALDLIKGQAEGVERAQQELSCLMRLAISLASSRGYAVDEVKNVLTQARDVCDRLGNGSDLYPVLRGLCTFSIVRSDLEVAEELARRCLKIGEQTGSEAYLIEGHTPLGYILVGRGEYRRGQFHLEQALRLYAENEASGLVFPTEQDPKVSCGSLLAIAMHMQGDFLESERTSREALVWARTLNRPFDLTYALCFAAIVARLRGDYPQAKRSAEEAVKVSETHGFGAWLLCARLNLACAVGHLGQIDEAIEVLEPTLASYSQVGGRFLATDFIGQLAVFQGAANRLEQARTTIDAAISQAISCDDLFYLSRLHRIRADIMTKTKVPNFALVEAELRQAVSIARSQGAVTFEAEAVARLNEVIEHRALTSA